MGETPAHLQPGQTLIFLGDHTSPDEPGYVRVIQDVLARFHPELRLNLISAGAKGQTAGGLRSPLLMQIMSSSKPDWLVIGVGLGDAMREPSARRLLEEYRRRQAQAEIERDDAESVFGPELRMRRQEIGPVNDVGREPQPPLHNLDTFKSDLAAALNDFRAAGVRPCVLTTIVVGNDLQNPVNSVLRLYNRAIREAAGQSNALLIDMEKTFRDLFDRATTYKQKVALTGPNGELNAQGQALMARTVLHGLGVLPYPGYRPPR